LQDPRRQFGLWLRPAWLFLLAGLAILVASVLTPAAEDLRKARWQRDRALAVEAHRQVRLARYEEYLAALDGRDPTLITALAEAQLHQIPGDRRTVPGQVADADSSVSVFPALEPPALHLREYRPVDSVLARWTADPLSRRWLLLAGGVCVLVGLMPTSRGWTGLAGPATYLAD
jgi:hypothetical protein